MQRNRVDVHRPAFGHDFVRLSDLLLLRQWPEVHRPDFAARVDVLSIRNDSHDFEPAGELLVEDPEVAADGVFLREELLHECLIDHRNELRSRRVGVCESTPSDNRLPDGLEELRTDAVPRGTVMCISSGYRAAFNVHALAPVIAFQRAIQSQPYALHSRYCTELLFEPLIQWLQPVE